MAMLKNGISDWIQMYIIEGNWQSQSTGIIYIL
jgi:hypothetical protein